MLVREIMTPNPSIISVEDHASTLDEIMFSRRIRHVPVVNGGRKLAGVVSHRDIVAQLPAKFNQMSVEDRKFYLDLIHVDEIMHAKPVTLRPETGILDAVKTMQANKVGCLPVVDDDQQVVGIVTGGDFLNALIGILERP